MDKEIREEQELDPEAVLGDDTLLADDSLGDLSDGLDENEEDEDDFGFDNQDE